MATRFHEGAWPRKPPNRRNSATAA